MTVAEDNFDSCGQIGAKANKLQEQQRLCSLSSYLLALLRSSAGLGTVEKAFRPDNVGMQDGQDPLTNLMTSQTQQGALQSNSRSSTRLISGNTM